MLKASPNFHQGINFIQISSLPYEQQELFASWVPQSAKMKMEINNITLPDCVEYQDYAYWFDFQYQNQNSLLESSL
ncbi:MAG: hypothetical protein ACQETL_04130 [Bacteroidota bacterium]